MASSQQRVSNLNETSSARAPSPTTVSSLGVSTPETPATDQQVLKDPAGSHPQIEIESGVWVFDSRITDIHELHRKCVENEWIYASDYVFAIVDDELIELEPFDSKPIPCDVAGCRCEEGANTTIGAEEGESANDADNETSES